MDDDQRLSELSRRASELDGEIERLSMLRREVAMEAGRITAAQLDAAPEPPPGKALDTGRLAATIERKCQHLLESENPIGLEGLLRSPCIRVGMTPVLVSDDGEHTTVVIHIDAHLFRGLVGVSANTSAGEVEEDVGTDLVVDLMGEYIVDLARDARPGEIGWWGITSGDLPLTLDELRRQLPAGQTWLHPRIDDL